jgi:hypothetical protein
MDQADRDFPSRHRFVEVKKYALKDDETLPQDKFIEKKLEHDSSKPGLKTVPPPESNFWKETITDVVKHSGENAKGPWTLFRINTQDPEKTATTFNEALAKDAEIMIGQEVRLLIEPNKRKPGTFSYLGFEPIPQPETAALWPEEPKETNPF